MTTVRGWLVPASERHVMIPELLPPRDADRMPAVPRIRFPRSRPVLAYLPFRLPAIGLLVDVYG